MESPKFSNQIKCRKRKKRKVTHKSSSQPPTAITTISRTTSVWDQNPSPELPTGWQIENVPYAQVWKDTMSETSLVRFFMTESVAANQTIPQVDLITAFCPDNTLEVLESGAGIPPDNVCLLDDRTNDGKVSIGRRHLEPLNAHQLYLELRKEVGNFSIKLHPAGNGAQALQLNADRRLLFITDLNRWTMMAIISTASIHQARALRDIFYRHLAFTGFIGAAIPPAGFPTFRLAFDLPFYALRTTLAHDPPRDLRARGDQSTLRKVLDLSFLSRRSVGSLHPTYIHNLCEAQISVLVTGSDSWRWVAYCFVDTYYEHIDKRESVEEYCEEHETDTDSHATFRPDPLAAGKRDANMPVLTPREYFLIVLESRLQQVKDEWHVLVVYLKDKIAGYISTCPITMQTPSSPSPIDAPTVAESHSWAVRTRTLLRKFTQNLKAIINQLESLQTDQTFTSVTGPFSRRLPAILASTKQLAIFLQDLENLCQDCNVYIDSPTDKPQLSFRLNDDGNRDGKIQTRVAGFSETTNFVLLYVLTPITLAANTLSMQEKVIQPLLKLNGASFIILVLAFTVFIWLVVGVLRNWEHIKKGLGRFRKPANSDDLESVEQ
ncbi:hypothetical protein EDB81DRAFT_684310 [Dactylonectria macrodidyma]|uniref:Uncharacterized protein n=1 Tax=Dactylonectria macrodidyma TaxID=307937 RepID=A0A9P9F8V7_9HYPO|nr:hypothetical protein EDB81DRAFT_684310 [Dactylonectria macrodidyma]